MKYYSKEYWVNDKVQKTAGVKARDDLDAVMASIGYQELAVYYSDEKGGASGNPLAKFKKQLSIYNSLKKSYSPLQRGDILFIQFPLNQTTVFYRFLIRRMRARGVHLIFLIHDLQSLRHGRLATTSRLKKIKTSFGETAVLRNANRVIVHNSLMLKRLADMGVPEDKMIPLEMFDYLIPRFDPARRTGKTGRSKPVIIAGNLRPHKAAYAYHLPDSCAFNLYGVDYSGELNKGSQYFGAFPPDEVPYVMEGSFGLVWDGDTADTCSGTFGEYLKINNPHKTSLYLAAGIPVAIWKQAALADFIVKNNAGIAVDSLHDLRAAIDRLTDAEYAEMVKNAERIGERLRDGAYTKEAVRRCE